ncbi:MAG: trypsin-like peptidase domain-containing protein [Pseudoflavonifractor sp.]
MQTYFYEREYGPVPDQWQAPTGPQPAGKYQYQYRNPPRRTRKWVAPVIFGSFLLLIGGCIVALLLFGQVVENHNFSFGGEFPGDAFPPSVSFYPQIEAEEETPTTIPRAPLVQGIELEIAPAGQPLTLQEIYKKCAPSIVSIQTGKAGASAAGTGVTLTADGYIITNHHVIEGGSQVEVLLSNGERYPALLVGSDKQNDLAVLKIEAKGLIPAQFGNSDDLQVGDIAVAIGNPLGEELRGTMTSGIISAIDRDVQVEGDKMNLIQTTAALNSGNSGGALLNESGQVVGITNMKMMSNYDTIEGLGFAIPTTNTVKPVVEALLSQGHVTGRPTLGFTGTSLTPENADAQDMPEGVYVVSVEEKSDAKRQGLRPGDVITECNDVQIFNVEDINEMKAGYEVGDKMTFTVLRGERELTLSIRLMERCELD